jgi:hypothetical protein
MTVGVEFVNFLSHNENPLIKPKEIFEGDSYTEGSLTEGVTDIIKNETILRKHLLSSNVVSYMKDAYLKETNSKSKNLSKKYLTKEKLFIEYLTKALNNGDLMFSILLDLNVSKDDEDKAFLKRILSLKNIDILNAFTKLNQTF